MIWYSWIYKYIYRKKKFKHFLNLFTLFDMIDYINNKYVKIKLIFIVWKFVAQITSAIYYTFIIQIFVIININFNFTVSYNIIDFLFILF